MTLNLEKLYLLLTVLAPHLLLIEASYFSNATERVQKIRKLIETGEYEVDIAKYTWYSQARN